MYFSFHMFMVLNSLVLTLTTVVVKYSCKSIHYISFYLSNYKQVFINEIQLCGKSKYISDDTAQTYDRFNNSCLGYPLPSSITVVLTRTVSKVTDDLLGIKQCICAVRSPEGRSRVSAGACPDQCPGNVLTTSNRAGLTGPLWPFSHIAGNCWDS